MPQFAVVLTSRGRTVDRLIVEADFASMAIFKYLRDYTLDGALPSVIVSAKPAEYAYAGASKPGSVGTAHLCNQVDG